MLINIGILLLSVFGYVHCAEGTDYTRSGANFDQTETDPQFYGRLAQFAVGASSSTLPAPAVPLEHPDEAVDRIARELLLNCLSVDGSVKLSKCPTGDKNDFIILQSIIDNREMALDILFSERNADRLFPASTENTRYRLEWQVLFVAAFCDDPEASDRISSILENICSINPEKFASLVAGLGDSLGVVPEVLGRFGDEKGIISKISQNPLSNATITAFLAKLAEGWVNGIEGGDIDKAVEYNRAFSFLARALLPN